MTIRQSFIPVVTNDSQVVGFVPVSPAIEFNGGETTVSLSGITYGLKWINVGGRKPPFNRREIAAIPITPSEWRMNNFPVGYMPNPEYYFAPFYTERSIVHDSGSPATDWFMWLFTYGDTIQTGTVEPVPDPENPEEMIDVWELSAEFASNPNCSYIDVEWAQFAPEGKEPVSITVQSTPVWLAVMFAASDLSANTLGFTMAQASPIMRMFRRDTVTPGEYMIEGIRILSSDGTTSEFNLRLVVT